MIPTAEALTPSLTSRLSPETRTKWKERYRTAKKYGIRAAFTGVTGVGLFSLVKEAAVEGVTRHGKRYVGSILVHSGLTCVSERINFYVDKAVF